MRTATVGDNSLAYAQPPFCHYQESPPPHPYAHNSRKHNNAVAPSLGSRGGNHAIASQHFWMMALLPHHNRRLKKQRSSLNSKKPSHNRNNRSDDNWKPVLVSPESSRRHDDVYLSRQATTITPVTTANSTETTTAGDMSSQGSHHHLTHSNNNTTIHPQQQQLVHTTSSSSTALPALSPPPPPPPRLLAPTQQPLYTGCSPCGSPPRLNATTTTTTTTTTTLVSSPTSIPLEITIVHHHHHSNTGGPTRIRAETCSIRREALFNDSMDAYIGHQEEDHDDEDEHGSSESSTDLDHFMTLLDLQEPPASSVVVGRDNDVEAVDDDFRESPVMSSHPHHPLLKLVRPLHRHHQANHHHNGGAAATTSLEEIELLPCWNKFHHALLTHHHASNTQHNAIWGLTTTTLHDNGATTPIPLLPPTTTSRANCDCRSEEEEHSRRSWPSDEECTGQGRQRLLRCHSCCRDFMCGGSVLSAKDSRVATVEPANAVMNGL
jgi:hypothetical protein